MHLLLLTLLSCAGRTGPAPPPEPAASGDRTALVAALGRVSRRIANAAFSGGVPRWRLAELAYLQTHLEALDAAQQGGPLPSGCTRLPAPPLSCARISVPEVAPLWTPWPGLEVTHRADPDGRRWVLGRDAATVRWAADDGLAVVVAGEACHGPVLVGDEVWFVSGSGCDRLERRRASDGTPVGDQACPGATGLAANGTAGVVGCGAGFEVRRAGDFRERWTALGSGSALSQDGDAVIGGRFLYRDDGLEEIDVAGPCAFLDPAHLVCFEERAFVTRDLSGRVLTRSDPVDGDEKALGAPEVLCGGAEIVQRLSGAEVVWRRRSCPVSHTAPGAEPPRSARRTVSGRAVDADDHPVAEADVQVWVPGPSVRGGGGAPYWLVDLLSSERAVGHTTTDDQGRFLLADLPGDRSLELEVQAGAGRTRVAPLLPTGIEVALDLRLERGRTSERDAVRRHPTPGCVLRGSAELVEAPCDAIVERLPQGLLEPLQVVPEGDGRFALMEPRVVRIELPDGLTPDLVFLLGPDDRERQADQGEIRDPPAGRHRVQVRSGTVFLEGTIEVPDATGLHPVALEVERRGPAFARTRVVDGLGHPVPGAVVWVADPLRDRVVPTNADLDGLLEVPLDRDGLGAFSLVDPRLGPPGEVPDVLSTGPEPMPDDGVDAPWWEARPTRELLIGEWRDGASPVALEITADTFRGQPYEVVLEAPGGLVLEFEGGNITLAALADPDRLWLAGLSSGTWTRARDPGALNPFQQEVVERMLPWEPEGLAKAPDPVRDLDAFAACAGGDNHPRCLGTGRELQVFRAHRAVEWRDPGSLSDTWIADTLAHVEAGLTCHPDEVPRLVASLGEGRCVELPMAPPSTGVSRDTSAPLVAALRERSRADSAGLLDLLELPPPWFALDYVRYACIIDDGSVQSWMAWRGGGALVGLYLLWRLDPDAEQPEHVGCPRPSDPTDEPAPGGAGGGAVEPPQTR